MLFFAAILTSIDCFIIGLSLKIEQKKLSMDKLLCLPLFLFILYDAFLFLFSKITWPFHDLKIQFHLFLLLAILAYKENNNIYQNISLRKLFLLFFTNSLDGLLVASTFLGQKHPFYLSFIFTSITFLFFMIGFKTPLKLKKKKYTISIIFLLLAFLSLF